MITLFNPPSESSNLVALVSRSELFVSYRNAFREATGRLLRFTQNSEVSGFPPCLKIPVKVAGKPIGFLSVDPYRTIGLEDDLFNNFAHQMLDGGATPSQLRTARKTYDHLPAMSQSLAHAVETMLRIFSIQLGEFAERAFLQSTCNEPPAISKARGYILGHLGEELALDDVARHAGVSLYHFCKVFKKTTGHTFTEFVTKARVEEAKRLLMHPQMRVTEIAYDVGFQSLSQFNRSFKKITAQSPSEYRCAHGCRPGIAA